ncbi:MAG: hypothetical protein EPO61_13010 [Nitrospirae bacterium]|nr:MAG: hypothetical protein EPO61_13010 [Nitrospirota bacterium]
MLPRQGMGVLASILLGLTLLACTPWLEDFLSSATDRATQEDVRQRLGQPSLKAPLEGGGEIWAYHMTYASYAGGAGKTSCFEYRLTFDKLKVLRQWDAHACGAKQAEER